MAKTLRVRTRSGWVTKPSADLPENVLSAAEVDDNFLGVIDDLANDTDPANGAGMVGRAIAEFADYAAVRALTSDCKSKTIFVTGLLVTAKPSGISGIFQLDPTDTTSADNGGTVLVDASGRRWKRQGFDKVSILWFGADPTGVNSSSAAMTAAFIAAGPTGSVEAPFGRYRLSSAVDVLCGLTGQGSGTVFSPDAGVGAFVVRAGRADYRYSSTIGNFSVDFTHLSTITPADVGMWLCKGTTPAAQSGINNVTFEDIFIHGGYRSIQMLPTDLGNLWNVKFSRIMCFKFSERGIYIDTTGSNGSLNVSFDTVTCDAYNLPAAKGAMIRGIANVKYYGTATSETGGAGSCLNMLDCTNVDVRLQIEGVTVSAATQGLVSFANCKTVEISLTSQTCTFNQGAGVRASFIYFDTNCLSAVIRAFSEYGNTYTSGTTTKINLNNGVSSNTKLCILDQNITRSDVYASTSVLESTQFPDTNYALQKTRTTRRVQSLDVLIPNATATTIADVADYADRPYQVAGMYLVQGVWSVDNGVGFTDLVLVTGVGQTAPQTAVVISSNSVAGGHSRSYSVSSGGLKLTLSPPSGAYRASCTGIDQAGCAN